MSENDLAGAFTLTLLLSVAMYLTLFGCAGTAARALQTPELVTVLRVTGLGLLLVPLRSVPAAILERRLQLNRLTTIGLFSTVIQGCLILTLVLSGWGYWSLIVGYMVPRVLNVLFLAWQISWVPRFRWPGGWSNPLVSFGIHYTGSRLCWFIYRNVDYLIVGRLMGPIALGYYSFAFMLISMPVDKIVATCNQVAFPIFCRMSHDLERVRDWYLRLSILFGVLATPALVGLALVANDAILVALGQKWTPAVLPVQIMSLAGVFMVLGSSIDVLYIARGRPDINFRFTAISLVVYPPLFYLSGRNFGLTGVTLVWAVFYPIMVLLLIGVTRSITGISVREILSSPDASVDFDISHGVGSPRDPLRPSRRRWHPFAIGHLSPRRHYRVCPGNSHPRVGKPHRQCEIVVARTSKQQGRPACSLDGYVLVATPGS